MASTTLAAMDRYRLYLDIWTIWTGQISKEGLKGLADLSYEERLSKLGLLRKCTLTTSIYLK